MDEILPSIFGADILRLKEEIGFLEQQDTPILHVDMMDGNFVSNITFGPNQIAAMKKASKMTFDVHMMTAVPKDHLDDVIAAGAEMISVHHEATQHIHNIPQRIRKAGKKAGVVINPGTPNQSFIRKSYEKIRNLKDMIGDRPVQIEVDGGIDDMIAGQVKEAGADLIVVGGYLFGADSKERYMKLREAIR